MSSAVASLSVLRTARLMRVFKLARSWQELNRIITTVLHSFSQVMYLSLLVLLFVFIFALMGMQLFGYSFGNCTLPDAQQVCPPGMGDCPDYPDCYVPCDVDRVLTWFSVPGELVYLQVQATVGSTNLLLQQCLHCQFHSRCTYRSSSATIRAVMLMAFLLSTATCSTVLVGSPYNGQAFCEQFPRNSSYLGNATAAVTADISAPAGTFQYWAQVGKAVVPDSRFDNIGWSLLTVFQVGQDGCSFSFHAYTTCSNLHAGVGVLLLYLCRKA